MINTVPKLDSTCQRKKHDRLNDGSVTLLSLLSASDFAQPLIRYSLMNMRQDRNQQTIACQVLAELNKL